jgi:predicted ATP-grasp superfamily ATP-dependent carboligase
MRIRAFELTEPVPELRDPHAIATVRPWIDVSNVGTLTLGRLEADLNAADLAELARPGDFLDFTRYRPTLHLKEDRREVHLPNVTIKYATREQHRDFVFLHLLEPHMQAEEYVESVLEVLGSLGVRRYGLIGSMYDMIPYTRPLLITGVASGPTLQEELDRAGVVASDYEGPTTITYLVSQRASEMGIEAFSLIVHLPQYLTMENDYRGETRLMEVLSHLYGLPPADEDAEKAREQHDQVRRIAEQWIQQEPRYELILRQLEAYYDSRVERGKGEAELSPELEKLLQDMQRRFSEGS